MNWSRSNLQATSRPLQTESQVSSLERFNLDQLANGADNQVFLLLEVG